MVRIASATGLALALMAGVAYADDAHETTQADSPAKTLADSKVTLQNGAMTSSLPIVVPSFHGIEPKLALSYNSSAGNGLVGVGWDLDGFSVIERAGPGHGSPHYGKAWDSDAYYLDGEELVPSAALNGNYATRRQHFLRIVGTAASWTVARPNGTVATYSPVYVAGAATFRFGISSVRDVHGNVVNYAWQCDTLDCYPKSISYGNVTIIFYREARPDPFTFATGYKLGRTNDRLMSISVSVSSSTGSSLVRAYKITYTSSQRSKRSLIDSVQQYGRDATVDSAGNVSGPTTLPPLKVTWSNTATGFESKLQMSDQFGLSLATWACSQVTTGDFNGDGRADLVLRYGRCAPYDEYGSVKAYLLLANASGSFNNAIDITDLNGMSTLVWQTTKVLASGDFNGDGIADLLLQCDNPNSGNEIYRLLGSSTGAFSTPVDISEAVLGDPVWEVSTATAADFNGDGKTDLLIRPTTTAGVWDAYLLTATSGGNFTSAKITNAYGMSVDKWNSEIVLGDFNGDGRADMLLRNIAPSYNADILLASPSGGFETYINVTSAYGMPTGSWQGSHFVPGDYNGDGRTDLLLVGKDNNSLPFQMLYAQGSDGLTTGTGPAVFENAVNVTNMWGMTSQLWRHASERSGDFNGDGRADLLVASDGTSPYDPSLILYSNGAGFETAVDITNLYGMDGAHWAFNDARIADFDGDGDDDVIPLPSGYTSTPPEAVLLKGLGSGTDLVTTLANGYGGATSVSYLPSSSWQNTNNPPTTQTVTAQTTIDGRGWTSTTNYSYANGKWDPVERRHLGFGYVKATDPTGAYQESDYYQDEGFDVGELKDLRQFNASGGKMTETVRTVTTTREKPAPTPSTWIAALTTQDDWECNGGSACKQVEKKFDYDGYGNIKSMTEMGEVVNGNPISGDERTTKYDYTSANAAYMVNYPSVITVYQGPSASGTVLKQSRFYYDNGGLAAAPSKGDLTRTENWLNTTGAFIASTATYDGFGNQSSVTDPLGHVTSTNWESTLGLFPLTSTNALNQMASMTWDPVCGTQSQATDLNGKVTSWTYDNLCRRTKETRPDGGYTTYGYSNFGSPTTQYTSETINGTLWRRNFFDGLGRQWQSSKNGVDGSHTEAVRTNYNSQGLVSGTTAPFGTGETPVWTYYSYDALRRLTKTSFTDSATYGSNSFRQVVYGNWTTTTCDELGKQRTRYRDAYGQVRQVREYNGSTSGCVLAPACTLGSTCWDTKIDYDLLGRQIMVTDALGNISTNTYDSLGRLTAMTDIDLGSWSYVYDDGGNLNTQTNAKGQKIIYQYDALNRRVGKDAPGVIFHPTLSGKSAGSVSAASVADNGASISADYWYDEAGHGASVGRLTRVVDTTGSTSYTYDSMGRVTAEQKTINGVSYSTSHGYDTFGRVTSVTYPDGLNVPYTYDGAGRMFTAGGFVTSATYDARGNPLTRSLVNGVQDTWTYDANRFWLRFANSYLGATPLRNMQFWVNPRGELVSRYNGIGSMKDQWSYTYDDLRRLTLATNSVDSTLTQNFAYDGLGRMTSQTGVGTYVYPARGTGPQHAPASVNGGAFTYDLDGNLASGAGNTLTYDFENHPRTANGLGMAYDGTGTRVTEGNTVFVSNLYEKDTATGVVTDYIFFNDSMVARRRTGVISYYHGDKLGSVDTITGTTGGILVQKTYSPFGKLLLQSGALADSFGLAGQRLDPTGLYHMGAREMAPGLGIFVTPDPSNAPDAEKPQTMNRFAYVENSPTNLFDPTGYAEQEKGFADSLAEFFNHFTGADNHSENPQFSAASQFFTKSNSRYIQHEIDTAPQQTKEAIDLVLLASAFTPMGFDGPDELLAGRYLAKESGPLIDSGVAAAKTASTEIGSIYRGVHAGHPAMADALAGRAVPGNVAGTVSAELHNATNSAEVLAQSPFTSWTHDIAVAQARAGTNGVLLSVPAGAPPAGATWSWEFSPDIYGESEVLLRGVREDCCVLSPR
jgi:RHS repeat-associated protein